MGYSDLVGIPFRWCGRTLEALDCWGVVMEVYRRLGIAVDDIAEYHDMPTADIVPLFKAHGTAWHAASPPFAPYDVLLFAGQCCGNAATHCAVWLGSGRMLHATEKAGVTIARWRHFAARFLAAYRHEELSRCHA